MNKKERDKKWRDAHKEHIAEYNKQYNQDHPEVMKEWREEHKEETRAYAREYGKRHPRPPRPRMPPGIRMPRMTKQEHAERKKQLCAEIRSVVFDHYGGAKCACCGETIERFLCVDHINGGGNKQRATLRIGGGVGFYRWLRKNGYPEGYRVLCHNCNYAESQGGCPHKVGPDRLDEGAST